MISHLTLTPFSRSWLLISNRMTLLTLLTLLLFLWPVEERWWELKWMERRRRVKIDRGSLRVPWKFSRVQRLLQGKQRISWSKKLPRSNFRLTISRSKLRNYWMIIWLNKGSRRGLRNELTLKSDSLQIQGQSRGKTTPNLHQFEFITRESRRHWTLI